MSRRYGTVLHIQKREHICACCNDFFELTHDSALRDRERIGYCRAAESDHCDHVLYRQHTACKEHKHRPEFHAGERLDMVIES